MYDLADNLLHIRSSETAYDLEALEKPQETKAFAIYSILPLSLSVENIYNLIL